MIRVDANIILRFLLRDNEDMFLISKEVLKQNVIISNEVLAEVVYVLEKTYAIKRDTVFDRLYNLVNFENIKNYDKKFVLKAFEIYNNTKLDFVDCLLCAYSEMDEVKTFDKKLLKCIDNLQKK
ncbi:MAG: type II toxin-antitoxin system VapC family toxin [Epsilonproteobacteria bacterium]|nr:type II toxin-antitoxin system VapC family toxin [Campylobacterota bacterium]